MKKRILAHLSYMEDVLKKLNDKNEEELEVIRRRHMTEIYFFMHERLIHLIVTVLFALGTFMTLFTYLMVENIALIVLMVALMVLLIPYINHYYLLENGVQKMYVQYDKLMEEINQRNNRKKED